jgi:uncharacterized repeat protein (TIGR03987 family)
MDAQLATSITLMMSALLCYSVGVWSEKIAGKLKAWHLIFFWIGFIADTSGTTLMSIMSGTFTLSVHSITGAAAILLMFAHAVWATIVLMRHDKQAIAGFHRLSIFVWGVWMIPFLTGLILAM